MKSYNIDTSYNEYSNEVVFKVIKTLIKDTSKDEYIKMLLISNCINHITDEVLLNSTVNFFKECDWYKTESEIQMPLKNMLNGSVYNDQDKTYIKAIIYSALLNYEVIIRYYKEALKDNIPELRFNVIERCVYHNSEEVFNTVRKAIIQYVGEELIIPLSPEDQEIEFNKMINSMALFDYENDSSTFDPEIKYLSIRKENINPITDDKYGNSYQSIFENGAFEIFKKWMHDTEDKPHKKISFIFQKLKTDGKLRSTNFRVLLEWVYKYNFVDDETYKTMRLEGAFDSPSKILTKRRLELYNSIIGN